MKKQFKHNVEPGDAFTLIGFFSHILNHIGNICSLPFDAYATGKACCDPTVCQPKEPSAASSSVALG